MAPGADGHARAEVLGPRVAVESPAQEDVEPATLRVLGAEAAISDAQKSTRPGVGFGLLRTAGARTSSKRCSTETWRQ